VVGRGLHQRTAQALRFQRRQLFVREPVQRIHGADIGTLSYRSGMSDWLETGLPHLWLPYTQMKTANPPLPVVATDGVRIRLADGRELIVGIASWWTACHGYNHPHI